MCCRVCNRRRKCGFKDTGFLKCVFNCSDHHQVNKYVENNYYYLKCNLRKSQSIRGRVIKRLNWFEQQNKSKLDFQSENLRLIFDITWPKILNTSNRKRSVQPILNECVQSWSQCLVLVLESFNITTELKTTKTNF